MLKLLFGISVTLLEKSTNSTARYFKIVGLIVWMHRLLIQTWVVAILE